MEYIILSSYGDQLVQAEIGYLSSKNLDKVMRECPNLEVSRYLVCSGSRKIENWRCISVIGPRLKILDIYGGVNDGIDALKQCTGLRSLTLYGFCDVTADSALEH